MAIRVSQRFTGDDIVTALEAVRQRRGAVPDAIRVDNGKLCKPGGGLSNGRAYDSAPSLPFLGSPGDADSLEGGASAGF